LREAVDGRQRTVNNMSFFSIEATICITHSLWLVGFLLCRFCIAILIVNVACGLFTAKNAAAGDLQNYRLFRLLVEMTLLPWMDKELQFLKERLNLIMK
jgi:hypothetical protein